MNKAITTAVLLCAFGCNDKTEYREEIKLKVSKPPVEIVKKDNDRPVIIKLDRLSFGDAFNIQYRAKGEGKTFWWRSNQYTTDLRKE